MKTSGFWADLFGVCAGVALVSWAMKLVFKLPHLTAAQGGAIAVALLVLSKLHDISDNLTASRRLLDERLPRAE